jgi:hypothetical protein
MDDDPLYPPEGPWGPEGPPSDRGTWVDPVGWWQLMDGAWRWVTDPTPRA